MGLTTNSVHTRLTRSIAVNILNGVYPVGERLPVESELLNTFSVSRTALREAFRTLAAKGLVVSRKRTGTIVASQGDWNLLDTGVLNWIEKTNMQMYLLRQVSEARQIFEPEAAALAARRATATEVAAIEVAFLKMQEEAYQNENVDAWSEADLSFHLAVLVASHNRVLQELGGVIGAALKTAFRISGQLNSDHRDTIALHGEVFRAIRYQQENAARLAMQKIIRAFLINLKLV